MIARCIYWAAMTIVFAVLSTNLETEWVVTLAAIAMGVCALALASVSQKALRTEQARRSLIPAKDVWRN